MPYQVDADGEVVFVKVCGACSAPLVRGTPDPCLGYIPGVAHACCGHGDVYAAYVVGWDGCAPNESIMAAEGRLDYWEYRYAQALTFFETYRREKND